MPDRVSPDQVFAGTAVKPEAGIGAQPGPVRAIVFFD
jgi:hypothetical protein